MDKFSDYEIHALKKLANIYKKIELSKVSLFIRKISYSIFIFKDRIKDKIKNR
jgi:hypothetical protein